MNDHKNPGAFDHDSDPAHTPGAGWVDEGGASHLGPATHLQSAPSDTTDAETSENAEEE